MLRSQMWRLVSVNSSIGLLGMCGGNCQVPFMCQMLWLLSQNASFGEMLLAFWHVAYVVRACLECVRCQSAVSFVSVRKRPSLRRRRALCLIAHTPHRLNESEPDEAAEAAKVKLWHGLLINIDAALTICIFGHWLNVTNDFW